MKGSVVGVGVVVVAAVGLVAFLTGEDAPPQAAGGELQERLEALERRVAELEAQRERPHAAPRAAGPRAAGSVAPAGSARPVARRLGGATAPADDAAPDPGTVVPGAPGVEGSSDAVTAKVLGAVDERIDAAVDKKIAELEKKKNKKPELDTVVELLELDASQRQLVETETRKGQQEIKTILEMPTADGTSLYEELVEVMAYGHARRPETGAMWGKWVGRIMKEKIPGTDQTYAARIEQAKTAVRQAFKKVMSEEQYAEFTEWAFDPTEIQGITDSPWKAMEGRVAERAAALGK